MSNDNSKDQFELELPPDLNGHGDPEGDMDDFVDHTDAFEQWQFWKMTQYASFKFRPTISEADIRRLGLCNLGQSLLTGQTVPVEVTAELVARIQDNDRAYRERQARDFDTYLLYVALGDWIDKKTDGVKETHVLVSKIYAYIKQLFRRTRLGRSAESAHAVFISRSPYNGCCPVLGIKIMENGKFLKNVVEFHHHIDPSNSSALATMPMCKLARQLYHSKEQMRIDNGEHIEKVNRAVWQYQRRIAGMKPVIVWDEELRSSTND